MIFHKITGAAGLTRIKQPLDASGQIRPEEVFLQVVEREKARADMNGHGFSLVVIDISLLPDLSCVTEHLRRQIRITDEIGWFGRDRLGILLYNTPQAGAHHFIKNCLRGLGDLLPEQRCSVSSYPLEWQRRKEMLGAE